ncbi:hypothetical protein CGMCC3_g15826 [Colletotrichum fructicola]|uniref:Uncharacterized protein n=1 Tax=Colletotrichum fructicola (strain Nara gc5) TaxID=1213859 RepID=L2GG48_COLFN|nr:uncharacterized protein CGMCC3_g15826 [Colletotrichum fructicola]KAE9568032.1 hypothetical protein CGMCC3_g15826 [Colletotrichum fructicola]KAF4418799.1 hypothetical protein CFRS1_v014965 [Colletotrichum fructicola]KAF4474336.1 hypothetical protein CGGC5_v016926 [Colletotrichum fructicola Nara gc5]KAF4881796.1 hypothetical protein CGCFRS4_v015205 [Colletotrichum fructicola]
MDQQLREQAATIQAYEDRDRGATSTEEGDDSQVNAMALDEPLQDVKKETQDEGLFVPRTLEDNTTLIVTDDDDDEDDPATLVSWKDMSAQYQDNEMGNITTYGYLKYLNRTYDVIGRGPRNAEKLELVSSRRDVRNDHENDLGSKDRRKSLRDDRGEKIKVDGINIQVHIQGVVWIASQNPEDPIALMDPRYWGKRKSEGKKNFRLPFTSIKLKWVTTRNGEKTVEKTFETRSTVRSIFGMTPKAAPRDYKIGERVVLEEGTMMPAADLAIFAAAIISWDRYEEWKKEPSTGKDRSPTPDEVVQTTETKQGRKKAT